MKLAKDHTGMRVDYSGLLNQSIKDIKHKSSANAEMLRQLLGHLEELGRRYYSGDENVVDEFLQLYCIEDNLREKLKSQNHEIHSNQ